MSVGLPEPARRWMAHAIAPGTPPASAVRLTMRGEIKLGRWRTFEAEETIEWPRAMEWRAALRLFGLPVRGFDRLVDGRAAMRWRILGVIPLVDAQGPDIDRSTAGRLAAELVWLPSVLAGPSVHWSARGEDAAEARLDVQGYPVALELAVESAGRLRHVRLERWGNPGGGPFRALDFGARVEEERTFGGYTIPTRLSVGWHFGSPRFDSEGEFFRAVIESAAFR